MALDFSDKSACATFVTDQTTLEPDDLETLLIVSAGKDANGEPVYRPYLVAALLLERVPYDDVLLKAENGVTFGDPAKTIAGWRAMQAALDAALGLTVPPGFPAVVTVSPATRWPYSGAVNTVVRF